MAVSLKVELDGTEEKGLKPKNRDRPVLLDFLCFTVPCLREIVPGCSATSMQSVYQFYVEDKQHLLDRSG